MATANPPDTPSADESVFYAMREQIIAEFDRIMREVKSRRDQLLSEVEEKRREFVLKNSAMIENLKEFEKMKFQMMCMSIKQNLAVKRHQESLVNIETDIDKLTTDMHHNVQLKYSCSLDQLIQQIKQFGEIIDFTSNLTLAKSNYFKKLSAVKSITLCTPIKIIGPMIRGLYLSSYSIGLHVDPYKELLYVTYSHSNTVMVFNANDLTFVREFGYSIGEDPTHVTVNKEFIFVLSTANNLLQYRPSDFSLVAERNSWFFQRYTVYIGIAVSEDNRVVIMHSDGSIKLFDALNPKEDIKLNLERFWQPNRGSCLRMVMRDNIIYILLTNKILLFVPFGDWNNISCYFKKEQGKIPDVENPSAFCIDSVGNIIVADSATNSIKFLSPEGDLIHTIGEVANCSDIAVHKNSIIVGCRFWKRISEIRIY